jgi:hypothetical protein
MKHIIAISKPKQRVEKREGNRQTCCRGLFFSYFEKNVPCCRKLSNYAKKVVNSLKYYKKIPSAHGIHGLLFNSSRRAI